MRRFAVVAILLLAAASLHAQTPQWNISGCNGDQGNTGKHSLFSHQERVCELRRIVLPLVGGQLNVSGMNGGIQVIGEDRGDIELDARVIAYASSKEEAEKVERQVEIVTSGTIHDEGPHVSGWFFSSGYSVHYRLHVPHHLSTELHTVNGGVDIQQVEGVLHAKTVNGGIRLEDVAGDVHASTVNGGVKILLTGDTWHGDGLSARSTNGGISVTAPDHYSAHLVTQTVNGGISVAFPVTVQGSLKRHLDTNLGQGGPTIDLQTVNGGVSVARQ